MTEDNWSARRDPSGSVDRRAEDWLARLHSPACGPEDRRQFQQWLAQHPAHWQAYNRVERIWAAAAHVEDPALHALADQVLSRGRRREQSPSRRGYLFGWLAAAATVAAVALGLVGSGWFATEPAAVTYATAIGEIRSFTLPDDSVITLDTDTVLHVRIGRQARNIALQRGQAQFTVAHDPRRPFAVRTLVAEVTALGTVFQVRNGVGVTEIGLLEGRVRVAPVSAEQASTPAQTLSPGERLVARADQPWTRAVVDPAAASGWLSGRLVFDAVPLHEAVETFNRYSRHKLRIDDPSIESTSIDGVFNAGDTESITLALQYAYPLRVEKLDGEMILRRRPE